LFVSHLGGLVVVGLVEDLELDDDFEVVNVVLDDVMLDDVVLDDVMLDDVVLGDVVLDDVVLDDVVLDEVVLDDVVLDDVVLDDVMLDDVVLDDLVLGDVMLDDVVLDDVVLDDVVLGDVVLNDVMLDDVVLDDVVLDDVVLDDDGCELEVELVLELLDVVIGLPPTAIRLLPEMTYTRLLPNIGRWNFARPTVPGTLVIGSSTPLVGTARKADNPRLVSAIQTTALPSFPFKLVTTGEPRQPIVDGEFATNSKFGRP
jgi:hypothetical protein